MPVNIDEMSTEVVGEPPARLANAGAPPPAERPDEVARLRSMLAEAARLERRLAAEGYDD